MDVFDFWIVTGATAVFFLGGFVKGAVGFALPMISVSLGASLMPAQTAVAAMILPTFVSNFAQAFRQGPGPLAETTARFWPIILTACVVIVLSAQILPGLEPRYFFVTLGLFTAFFSVAQLAGWRPRLRRSAERPASVAVGAVAGFFGGVAGTWGPPVVMFLTALGLEKREQVRATGAAFLAGSVVLTTAHIYTGILNQETALLSLAMIIPALIGQQLGVLAQDRLDLEQFRRLTLIVLCLAAVNLLRRAIFG